MSTVKYTAEHGEWEFTNPTTTVTQVPSSSAYGDRRAVLRIAITVRAIIIAKDAAAFKREEQRARDILTQSGGTFEWTEDSNVILMAKKSLDIRYGPYPTNLHFSKFYGDKFAHISWQLETVWPAGINKSGKSLSEVGDVSRLIKDENVLEFTFSVATTIDQNLYTRRTVSGLLHLTTTGNAIPDSQADFEGADIYRHTVEKFTPSIPYGWQRSLRNYSMSADGLTLTFTHVDEERYAVLPAGIVSGDVVLTAQNDWGSGAAPYSTLEINGFFEGARTQINAPYTAMTNLIAKVLMTIIPKTHSMNPLRFGFSRPLYRNRLDFNLSWTLWVADDFLLGESIERRTATYLVYLTTCAEDWINQYKNTLSTDLGPYGTTSVAGRSGQGTIAPPLGVIHSPDNPTEQGDNKAAVAVNTDQNYVFWHQQFEYTVTTGYVAIPVKAAGVDDVIQRVHNPQLYITVTGEATRSDQSPYLPNPPTEIVFNDTVTGEAKYKEVVLISANVTTHSPAIGPKFKVTWKYVLKVITTDIPPMYLYPETPFVETVDTGILSIKGGEK